MARWLGLVAFRSVHGDPGQAVVKRRLYAVNMLKSPVKKCAVQMQVRVAEVRRNKAKDLGSCSHQTVIHHGYVSGGDQLLWPRRRSRVGTSLSFR